MIDEASIRTVAAQTNVPPPILYALAQAPGMAMDTVEEVSDAATKLQQLFRQAGSWEGALSGLISGDTSAWQAPTSSVGGQVAYIMGIAGTRPQYAMSGWAPANPSEFTAGSRAFGQSIGQMAQQGGVITPQHQQTWYQAANIARIGAYAAVSGRAPSGAAAPFSFDVLPFDRSGLGSMTESYGDRSGPGAYPEQGNDYGLAHGTPLRAAISGKVQVVQPSNPHSNTGLTVYIVRPDGSKMYYGHLSGTADQLPVKNGDYVQAGQPIGAVGGVPGVDPFPGNSTGAHVEIGVYDSRGVLYDPRPMLEAPGLGQAPAQQPQSVSPPGSTGNTPQQPQLPDPAKVSEFARHLQAMNVEPEQFVREFPQTSALRRRLLGQPTTLDDYSRYAGMDVSTTTQAVRSEPHPVYPEFSAGQIHDAGMTASLLAPYYGGRQTSMYEVSRLVAGGAGLNDMIKHFSGDQSQLRVRGQGMQTE